LKIPKRTKMDIHLQNRTEQLKGSLAL